MKRLPALVLAVAAAAFSWYAFFFFRDNFSTHYPNKVLLAEAFRAGDIPWWSFHDGGGQPFAGSSNTQTFYPTNVLYLFLPAHVAFNLHVLLHLAIGWLAMRKLSRSAFAATVYTLSGVVISVMAPIYTAMIPVALLATERRNPRLLGLAFGLMLLAAEPVLLVGAVLSVAIIAIGRMRIAQLALAVLLSAIIAAPQLIALSEIAGEVERVYGMSARTVLATSLPPLRVVELFVWPVTGFLNDAGGMREKLFSTLFVGIIALVALVRKSRYTAVALTMLFFALGRYNPLLAFAVERFDSIRIMRFPEKFAVPLTVALCALIGVFFTKTRHKTLWAVVTLLPLLWTTWRAAPVDWFAPYDVAPVTPRRVYVRSTIAAGSLPAREEYRLRAQRLEPLFGAVAGLRFVLHRSPDRMHSLLSRIAEERFLSGQRRYLDVALGPDAVFLPSVLPARNVDEAVMLFERGADVAPMPITSAPARVVRYAELGQRVEIDVEAGGNALLLVNQSYFGAWVARMNGEELRTLPVNLDRLGVIVPRSGKIELTFGRRRVAVIAAWIASVFLMLALLVKERDGGAGEIERSADEDRAPA